MDGVEYPATGRVIPTYQIYGYGDLPFLAGDLWDDVDNNLDARARYHLGTNGLHLSDVDTRDGRSGGWHDRFRTWTWHRPGTAVPVVRLTKNLFRSHKTMPVATSTRTGTPSATTVRPASADPGTGPGSDPGRHLG
jgi:hypothetical protein